MINNFISHDLRKPFINQKADRKRDYIDYMTARLFTMFEWEGLPETIPSHIIEKLLQWGGNACVFKHEGKLYATFGGLGGELDYNYEPTLYVIANPYLNYCAELKIGYDCIRLRNDSLGKGLLPLHLRYADIMVENDITLRIADILRRMDHGIIADNDIAYESAKSFLNSVENGGLVPIASDEFFDGVTAIDTMKTSITDLIELQQYLKASWFNEIGLNANYNMKRERIAAPEAQMSDGSLLPLAEEMLRWRKRGAEEINNMFGTEIKVDFSGAWKREHEKQSFSVDATNNEDPELDGSEELKKDEPTENGEDIENNDGDNSGYVGDNNAEGVDATDSGIAENVDISIDINIDNDDSGDSNVLKEDSENEETFD